MYNPITQIRNYTSNHPSIMERVKQAGLVGLAAVVIGVLSWGCEQKNPNPENPKDKTKQTSAEDPYVYGTVINEFGTMVNYQKALETALADSNGIIGGNETFKFDKLTYGIQFKGDGGKIYTLTIHYSDWKKLEGLAKAIEPGSRIRIHQQNFYEHLSGLVGMVMDNQVSVVGKE